jgi:hypothetical protein
VPCAPLVRNNSNKNICISSEACKGDQNAVCRNPERLQRKGPLAYPTLLPVEGPN